MTSKKSVMSAIAGLAIFALPASALAGHHYDWDDRPRPYTLHDQVWHRGWFKHHRHYSATPVGDEEDEGEQGHFGRPGRPPAFLCDEDGDDCAPNPNQGGWDYDYGPPTSYYQAAPPAGYNLVQHRDWLVDRQRRAYHVLTLMRARHDTKAVHRISTVIHQLDARIAQDNQLLAGDRYQSPPIPYFPMESNPSYYYPRQSSADYGTYGYYPRYGYNPNSAASPGLNALTSMLGPLLGSQSP